MATPRRLSLRGVLFGLWLALFPLLAFLLEWPENSQRLRVGILIVTAVLLGGALAFSRRLPPLFYSLLALFSVAILFMSLPGRTPDSIALSAAYLSALRSYERVPYVWGGETGWGIDCSGLMRRSLECAFVREGLRTANPASIRAAIDLWWNDTTAREIGRGYDGRTALVTSCPSLKSLHSPLVQPGDMAVTDSGTHVMAYLGADQWIGADPLEEKVTIFSAPTTTSGWFTCPMNVVRWQRLSP